MEYDKNCWSCDGKGTMVSKGSYYQCSSCGATWNETLELGTYTDIATDKRGTNRTRSFHPVRKSGKVRPPLSDKSKVAKARAKRAGQPIY